MASRDGTTGQGAIDIFDTRNGKSVHTVCLKRNCVSCMAYSDRAQYCGTLEGYCFSISRNIEMVRSSAKPRYVSVSQDALDGIVVTAGGLWVSHICYIFFLHLDTLAFEGSIAHPRFGTVGQLKLSADGSTVWSAHMGGASVSAWNAVQRCHLFDVDIRKQMEMVGEQCNEQDAIIITAMESALDTGLASGHILVLREELLMWFHPYEEDVCFLVCIPCEGPYGTEKARVVSGGEALFKLTMVPSLPSYDSVDINGVPLDKAGTLVVWEACASRSLIQSKSSTYLESHQSVNEMIEKGQFKELVCSIEGHSGLDSTESTSLTEGGSISGLPSVTKTAHVQGATDAEQDASGPCVFTSVSAVANESDPSAVKIAQPHGMDKLDVRLPPDGCSSITMTCPKPAQLVDLVGQLEADSGLLMNGFGLAYWPHSAAARVELHTQEAFDEYLELDCRPALFVYPVA